MMFFHSFGFYAGICQGKIWVVNKGGPSVMLGPSAKFAEKGRTLHYINRTTYPVNPRKWFFSAAGRANLNSKTRCRLVSFSSNSREIYQL